MGKLDKLLFTIGVIDAVTSPVNKIMGKVNQLTHMAKSGMADIAAGAAGVVGSAMLIAGSMNPAIDSVAALSEVKSLQVADASLMKLNQTALEFTTQFGGNAPDVIRSAYDIQSSIAGLTGDELSTFTRTSNILAKATRADAAVITDYMGTMYGVFDKTANEIGKARWVEMLAGQTAKAVQLFKTDGPKMAQAFATLGSQAASMYSVPMHEQMAVMGQLQATMSGSESATKYRSFINGIANAQKTLGVSFTDESGKLLPIVQVLDKVQKVTGHIKNDVARGALLKRAFGSDEAVALIANLLPKTEQLQQNVDSLGSQTGMATAMKMADDMTISWDRLSGSGAAMFTAIGQSFYPIVDPLVSMLATGAAWITEFAIQFPTVSGYLTATAAGVIALVGAISAINIVVGIYKFLSAGASATTFLMGAATKAVTIANVLYGAALKGVITSKFLLVKAFRLSTYTQLASIAATKTMTFAMGQARAMALAYALSVAAAGGPLQLLKLGFIGLAKGVWRANLALLANPITWVVIAVAALTYGLYQAYNATGSLREGFKQWAADSLIIQSLRVLLHVIWTVLKGIGWVVWEVGKAMWGAFSGLLSVFSPVTDMLGSIWNWLMDISKAAANFLNAFMNGGGISGFFETLFKSEVETVPATPGLPEKVAAQDAHATGNQSANSEQVVYFNGSHQMLTDRQQVRLEKLSTDKVASYDSSVAMTTQLHSEKVNQNNNALVHQLHTSAAQERNEKSAIVSRVSNASKLERQHENRNRLEVLNTSASASEQKLDAVSNTLTSERIATSNSLATVHQLRNNATQERNERLTAASDVSNVTALKQLSDRYYRVDSLNNRASMSEEKINSVADTSATDRTITNSSLATVHQLNNETTFKATNNNQALQKVEKSTHSESQTKAVPASLQQHYRYDSEQNTTENARQELNTSLSSVNASRTASQLNSSNSSFNSSNERSDNSKHLYIDNVNVTTDNGQTFADDMWEIAS